MKRYTVVLDMMFGSIECVCDLTREEEETLTKYIDKTIECGGCSSNNPCIICSDFCGISSVSENDEDIREINDQLVREIIDHLNELDDDDNIDYEHEKEEVEGVEEETIIN